MYKKSSIRMGSHKLYHIVNLELGIKITVNLIGLGWRESPL